MTEAQARARIAAEPESVLDHMLLGMAVILVHDPFARRPRSSDARGRRVRDRAAEIGPEWLRETPLERKAEVAGYLLDPARRVAARRQHVHLPLDGFYKGLRMVALEKSKQSPAAPHAGAGAGSAQHPSCAPGKARDPSAPAGDGRVGGQKGGTAHLHVIEGERT